VLIQEQELAQQELVLAQVQELVLPLEQELIHEQVLPLEPELLLFLVRKLSR
jgi:hypothetical protein